MMSIKNTPTDFSLNIKANNTKDYVETKQINISIVNTPADLQPTK